MMTVGGIIFVYLRNTAETKLNGIMKNGTKETGNLKRGFSDNREESVLLKSAKVASSKAMRSSHALGLTVDIIRDNQIISVHPDKTETPGRIIHRRSAIPSGLKKGTVLKRK